MKLNLIQGDCLDAMKKLPANSVDSIVTDPPYGLSKDPDLKDVLTRWLAGEDYIHRGGGFMGKSWDSFVPGPSVWRECYRVLKPGGFLLSFFGSKTYDLGTTAIRLAGFEVRDQIMWVYGSGFPKSINISNAFRLSGYRDEAETWKGWGSGLKPAHEPICMARKPFKLTLIANILANGTGGMNIDACRIASPEGKTRGGRGRCSGATGFQSSPSYSDLDPRGRWPSNFLHDGLNGEEWTRYFYCPKTSKEDRNAGMTSPLMPGKEMVNRKVGSAGIEHPRAGAGGRSGARNFHPTVKPTPLMAWLCQLVTPEGGIILDPFMGSGSTGKAAIAKKFGFIGIENDPGYYSIACQRLFFQRDNI